MFFKKRGERDWYMGQQLSDSDLTDTGYKSKMPLYAWSHCGYGVDMDLHTDLNRKI